MKMNDYLKGASTAVRHCPGRKTCPIGALCERMTAEDCEFPLFPTVLEVERGELVWTDPHSDQRVFVIKSGLLSCMAGLDQARETPFAIYGRGYAAGLGELYISRAVGKTYYMRALAPSELCSLPAKPLRRMIESCPPDYIAGVMSSALTNLASASYAHVKMVSRPLLAERLAMLFMRVDELARREGHELEEVRLTHEELAVLTSSDRTSVTRTLHAMEKDGLIELGYRCVRLMPGLEHLGDLREEARVQFHLPPVLG